MDVDALIAFLIMNGQNWISAQRDLHYKYSAPLLENDIEPLKGFYLRETIERARIRNVPQIENPPFYNDLRQLGVPVPLDFSQMAGITFDDTILISDLYANTQSHISLIFHEMVHVVQYGLLGVDEFTSQYIQGWAQNGFEYVKIPLESAAYELQRRFDERPQSAFSIEKIVETRLWKLRPAT